METQNCVPVGVLVTAHYALESAFFALLEAGMIRLERYNGTIEFVPAEIGDSENLNIRAMSTVARLLDYKNKLTNDIADRFLAYVWLAALGEARHTDEKAEGDYPSLIPQDCSRDASSRFGLQFNPLNSNNRRLLKEVFELDWQSGYGGTPWRDIADSVKYYTVNKTVFVDYVVDLQHNNGTVFNKESAGNFSGLSFPWRYGEKGCIRMERLLDYKRDNNMLQPEEWVADLLPSVVVDLLNDIIRLVGGRTIIQNDPIVNEFDWFSPIQWGGGQLDDEGFAEASGNSYHCNRCGAKVSQDDVTNVEGDYWCESCYNNHAFTCDKCEDTFSIGSQSSDPTLCQGCFDDTHTECEKCGEYTDNDELEWVEFETSEWLLCNDCKDEIVECNTCAKKMWWEYANKYLHHYNGIVCLCDDCIKEWEARGYNSSQMTLDLDNTSDKVEDDSTLSPHHDRTGMWSWGETIEK